MFLFFYLFHFVHSIYIVQTNNSTLHFIFKNRIHEVKIPNMSKSKIEGDIVKSEETDIVLSSRSSINNILVTPDGQIFIKNQRFTVDSIIDSPKIIDNFVFQTQKRCGTSKLFDIIIFIVFLDLHILDTRTMSERLINFSYIYHPFASTKNIKVHGNVLKIKNETYSFSEDVIAVYDTKEIEGIKYMNRIYFYSGLEVYYPKEYESSFTLLYLIFIILVIFIFLIKRKSVKIVLELEKNENYTLYEGLYMHKRVLIKWYKKRTLEITEEINNLQEIHNNLYISRLVYYEDNFFNTFLVFEYSEEMNVKPTKAMLHQIVLAVKFLNEKNIFLKNFNPKNVRIQNGHVVLFNFVIKGDDKGWYSDCKEDDKIKNVFFSGCLLHYFITGYHPYDKRDLESDNDGQDQKDNKRHEDAIIDNQYDNKKNINAVTDKFENTVNPTPLDYESIQENILLKKYKIRIEDPLVHDLIYHTIKAKIPERTSLQRLSTHPYFWDDTSKFEFIARYSDILEGNPIQVKKIERNKTRIFTKPWDSYLCSLVSEELSVFRLYNFNSARDLIRVIRNKGRHYNQIPGSVKEVYKTFPEGFMGYWCGLFPGLLIVCYNCGYQLRTNELLEKFY